jgi:NAD(P)-dependent dehydrogenase (short-subunit alcohol dehydrogenase family)
MALVGKTYVVTGGASGIGQATVQKLLRQGATVHILDLADIPRYNGLPGQQVAHPGVDVGSRAQVHAMFSDIFAKKEPTWIDGLANCAGLLRTGPCSPDSTGDEAFALLWQVNVMGVWHTSTEFHEKLQKLRQLDVPRFAQATASIVNVGSMASVRGITGMSAYVASKHAVHGLTRTFAQELGPSGFRVNTIAPGVVNTPMMAGLIPDGAVNGAHRGAFKSLLEPEEIAETIVFLLGEGSSSITGQLIETNGGWP